MAELNSADDLLRRVMLTLEAHRGADDETMACEILGELSLESGPLAGTCPKDWVRPSQRRPRLAVSNR
jgi:hypothetical protein